MERQNTMVVKEEMRRQNGIKKVGKLAELYRADYSRSFVIAKDEGERCT